MAESLLCKTLDWDSEFFRRRVARVVPTRLTAETLREILVYCSSQNIDCLYFLAEAGDPATVKLAEKSGFHFMDIRMTLERPFKDVLKLNGGGQRIRSWQEEDISELKRIAKMSHRDSRFYYDPTFPSSMCDEFYETWIERSCHGYANHVLVAELDNKPAGYVTCHLGDQQTGSIGLFAVAANAQGRGLGQELIQGALRWFIDNGAKLATVVTQGRNTKAQRVYQQCGFVTRSVHLWYHWTRSSRNGNS
jgi:dTDP-4-amino-4,6-dideoxy-D-galactose acyltransferase